MAWDSRRFSLIALSVLTAFTVHLLLFAFAPVIPFIIDDLGLSYTEGGIILSICLFAIILARIPWGFLIDRIGYVQVMRYAFLIVGAASILRCFAPNFVIFIVFQALLGIGLSAVLPCLAMIVKLEFPDQIGLATGIYVAGFPVGDLFGYSAIALLPLPLQSDWRLVLFLFGAWSLIITVLWFAVHRQTSRPQLKSNEKISRVEMLRLLKKPQLWVVTGMCFCTIGVSDTLLSWLPSFLELQGVSIVESALIALMFPLGSLLGGPIVGYLSDRLGYRRPFIGVLAVSSGLFIALISFVPLFGLMIGILMAGIVISGIITLALAIPAEHPDFAASIGSAVALIASLGNSGSFVFPLLVGVILDATGSMTLPLFALALIAVITAPLSLGLLETGRPPTDTR